MADHQIQSYAKTKKCVHTMLWQMRLAFQNAIVHPNRLVNKRNFEREVSKSGRNFSKEKVEKSRAEERKPPSPLISPTHGVRLAISQQRITQELPLYLA